MKLCQFLVDCTILEFPLAPERTAAFVSTLIPVLDLALAAAIASNPASRTRCRFALCQISTATITGIHSRGIRLGRVQFLERRIRSAGVAVLVLLAALAALGLLDVGT